MASLEPIAVRTQRAETALATNKLIRNTYTLLAMTLAFSALTAGIAMVTQMPPLHWLIVLGGYFAEKPEYFFTLCGVFISSGRCG